MATTSGTGTGTPNRTAAAASRTAARRRARVQAEDARDDLAALRRDISQLSETVATLVSSQATYARERVKGKASDIYESGRDALASAEAQAKDATDELTRTIERNPLTAVAAALGIGFIIGVMNRGR
jgi:ElaB/YqjD/DUF883 family membrane-anchored ribosome-binding protein